MSADKSRTLVEKICQKTLDGQLTWEKTIEPGYVQTTLAGYVVNFCKTDGRSGTTFEIRLFDRENQLVETISDETFERPSAANLPGSMFIRMGDAYKVAVRQALGLDKILDEMIEDLGD